MKLRFNKARVSALYQNVLMQSKRIWQLARQFYFSLNSRQRLAALAGSVFIVLLLFIIILSGTSSKKENAYPVHFEMKSNAVKTEQPIVQNQTNSAQQLQVQLNQLETASAQQYDLVKAQLREIQNNMSSLASTQDVSALQQAVSQPNDALLNKVDDLQSSVKTIIKQTAQKTWVDPKVVEKYFRLVAIQGFSDGMRTIIDVDGNQMTLSIHEICPACRGWILNSMDFSNQSAVFVKPFNNQLRYVKLTANS